MPVELLHQELRNELGEILMRMIKKMDKLPIAYEANDEGHWSYTVEVKDGEIMWTHGRVIDPSGPRDENTSRWCVCGCAYKETSPNDKYKVSETEAMTRRNIVSSLLEKALGPKWESRVTY